MTSQTNSIGKKVEYGQHATTDVIDDALLCEVDMVHWLQYIVARCNMVHGRLAAKRNIPLLSREPAMLTIAYNATHWHMYISLVRFTSEATLKITELCKSMCALFLSFVCWRLSPLLDYKHLLTMARTITMGTKLTCADLPERKRASS